MIVYMNQQQQSRRQHRKASFDTYLHVILRLSILLLLHCFSSYNSVLSRPSGTADMSHGEELYSIMISERSQQHDGDTMIRVVGGYAPITNIRSNENVQEIGQLLLRTLQQEWGITDHASDAIPKHNDNDSKPELLTIPANKPIPKYTFQNKMKEYSSLMTSKNADSIDPSHGITATVVSGRQQVVAGMNYQLTIIFSSASTNNDNSIIMGGISDIVIYDQFGTTISVTQWGAELTSLQQMGSLLYDNIDDDEIADTNNGDDDDAP